MPDKSELLQTLRSAIKAAVAEARRDPEFLGRIVSTICSEFGLDALASLYIANKIKSKIKHDPK